MAGKDKDRRHGTRFAEFDPKGALIAASPDFLDGGDATTFLAGFVAFDGQPLSPDEALTLWRETGASIEAEARSGRWSLLSSHPNASGGQTLICSDITPISTRNALSRQLIEAHPLPISLHAPEDGQIFFQNDKALALFEVPPGSERKATISRYFPGASEEEAALTRLRDGASSEIFVTQAQSHTGRAFWVSGASTLVSHEGRELVFKTIADVTSLDRHDQENRHSQMLLADALRNLSEAVALFDEGGRLVICNDRYRALNAPVEEFIQPGVHWETILRELARRKIPRHAAGREAQWVLEVLAARESGESFEIPRMDGSILEVSVHPTSLEGFIVSEVDITARKEAEAAARQSETMLSTILEGSPANLCMSHIGSGEIIYRSPACADLFGQDASAKDQFAYAADRADFLIELLPTGRVDGFAADARKADGSIFPALFSARLIEFRGEDVMVASVTDLSEQLRARQALARANTRLRDAIEALDEGFALYDQNARLVMWNRRYAELNEHVREQIREGARYQDVLKAAAASGRLPDVEFQNLADEGLHNNNAARYEFRHADDSWFQVARNPTSDGGFVITRLDITERKRAEAAEREADARIRLIVEACPVILVMNRYSDGEVIYRTKTASASFGTHEGAENFWRDQDMRRSIATETYKTGRVDARTVDLLRPDGSLMKAAISCRLIDFGGEEMIVSHVYDLTERVAMEQELARQTEMLHQSEKLSALGELLAGVAHELNNPLSLVVGHALMLEEEITDPTLRNRIGKISAAAERCAKIVKTFLAMARQRPARLEAVSVAETIGTAVDVAGYGLRRSGADIALELVPNLPPINADADQLAQVFSNLVVNAEHAMAGMGAAGRLRIHVRPVAERVEITFDDNGPGIPAKIRKRIFEPFFTTKEVGDGTGIGLAFCHRIIGAHGGEITAGESPDGGARFVITLDIADRGKSDAPEATEETSATRHRALVIDDEEGVADLIASILRADGYEVDMVLSAEAALERLPGRYDLVLSDLNMPGLGGRALFGRIRENWPEVADRLGFITGDTMSPDAEAFLAKAGRPSLEKPVSPTELRQLAAHLAQGPEEGAAP